MSEKESLTSSIPVKVKDCRSCPSLEYEATPLLFDVFYPRYYRCSRMSGEGFLSLHYEQLTDIYTKCKLRQQIEAGKPSIASDIVDEIRTINILYGRLMQTGEILFPEDIQIVNQLHTPCRTKEDYWMKIGSLALLFERDLKPLRALIEKPEPAWKSLKLIETWLQQKGIPYDLDMIQVWKSIKELRNTTFPYHSGDARIVNILQFFDQGFPPEYPRLWDSILSRFLESLRKFRGILNNIIRMGQT